MTRPLRASVVTCALLTIAPACGDDERATGGAAGTTSSAISSATTTDATGTSASASTSAGTGGESPGPERPPQMTDVSILFPLPAVVGADDGLVAAAAVGGRGDVFPYALYELLPELSFFFEDREAQYAALRVVGARLDPCFAEGPDGAGCRRQVRLVVQPLQDQGSGVVAIDAAVHLFYELEESAFVGLLGDLTRAQSAADATGPLGVHRAIAREGLGGPAATAITAALRARIGAQNLSRVTFMQLTGHADVWDFGGYDLDGGSPVPIGIVGSAETRQTFANDPDAIVDFAATVDPVISPDDLGDFYDSAIARTLDDDALWPTYEAALRIENPSEHHSGSVACVPCHTSNAVVAWADRNTGLDARPSPLRFASTHDLTPPSSIHADDTRVLRAFGFHKTTPAVSSRTIFETATVVDAVAPLAP